MTKKKASFVKLGIKTGILVLSLPIKMFHFGLPTEDLTPEFNMKPMQRFNKLFYIGAGNDVLPLPIARSAIYIDVCDVNANVFISEVKESFKLVEEPFSKHDILENRPVIYLQFKWGDMANLTRYVL